MAGPRIAILGGTFDPIHSGHLRLAEEVRKKLGAERVVLVPASAQPLKERRAAASPEDRLAMARLAAAGRKWLEVSDLEVCRPPPSYTYETLAALRAAEPAADFFFVVGADAARDLDRWYRIEDLLGLASFVVASRPGFALEIPPGLRGRVRAIEIDALPVSSTEVRRRLAAGKDVAGLVDGAVLDYIRTRGLYRA
jgi:nicotinate-nucleotide adenylyltransferase